VPLSTFYVLGEPGAAVSLRIHTHVREEVIALYGFASRLELELFERLITISGVGPKLALAVLSGIEPAELIKAVRLENVARLTAIPGIGRKTAERISLELKDRLPPGLKAVDQTQHALSPADQVREDLISALVNLGYQLGAAEKAIDQVLKANPDASFEQSLRAVLKTMMRA
jgi:Holliday junction DNA helicase RuvA